MEIPKGGILTGSSYNFRCMSDRSAIPSASTTFLRMGNAMEHQPTSNNTKSNMAAPKPEILLIAWIVS
jgi:hypothetical protein